MLRRSAVAGTWYPADPSRLTADLQSYLETADTSGARESMPASARLVALVAPHAGLMYSGPVAAHAYRLLRHRTFDAAVLVGPSHYVAFEGVSLWPVGAFATPLGSVPIDERLASDIAAACPAVVERADAHAREHSLEMQLPFLGYLAPGVPIVPLVMGHQTRETATALGDGLARALHNRQALLIASSDLSHYFDRTTAATLDRQVAGDVDRLDADGLMARLERRPEHACGGGPIVSVLRAARALGATASRVVHYADSGDISGDKSAVVGYLAAAVWQ
jgi:AmmeMemoRadiSam system protein B